jgi:uncharacterized membrane protein YqjE
VIAIGLTHMAGYVLTGLQDAAALATVFVLVVVATLFGPWRVARAVRSHPRLSLLVVAVATPLVVLFLSSPTYMTAAR